MEGRSRARSRDCDARLDPTSSIRRPCILWLRKVHCNRLRDIQAGAHQVILNDPPVLEQGAARGVRMGHWKLHVTDVCHTQAQYRCQRVQSILDHHCICRKHSRVQQRQNVPLNPKLKETTVANIEKPKVKEHKNSTSTKKEWARYARPPPSVNLLI